MMHITVALPDDVAQEYYNASEKLKEVLEVGQPDAQILIGAAVCFFPEDRPVRIDTLDPDVRWIRFRISFEIQDVAIVRSDCGPDLPAKLSGSHGSRVSEKHRLFIAGRSYVGMRKQEIKIST